MKRFTRWINLNADLHLSWFIEWRFIWPTSVSNIILYLRNKKCRHCQLCVLRENSNAMDHDWSLRSYYQRVYVQPRGDIAGDNFYHPQRSCEGYVFTPLCHSVHRGGVCLSACWDTTTPPEAHPPGKHTPPGAPLGRTPPPGDDCRCGRYASYWSAFLLRNNFTRRGRIRNKQAKNDAPVVQYYWNFHCL